MRIKSHGLAHHSERELRRGRDLRRRRERLDGAAHVAAVALRAFVDLDLPALDTVAAMAWGCLPVMRTGAAGASMAHGVLTRVTHGAGMLIGAAGSAGCDMEPRGEAKMSALLLDGCGAPGGAAAPPGAVGT